MTHPKEMGQPAVGRQLSVLISGARLWLMEPSSSRRTSCRCTPIRRPGWRAWARFAGRDHNHVTSLMRD